MYIYTYIDTYLYIHIIDTYTHIVVPKLRTVLEHSPTVVADAYTDWPKPLVLASLFGKLY